MLTLAIAALSLVTIRRRRSISLNVDESESSKQATITKELCHSRAKVTLITSIHLHLQFQSLSKFSEYFIKGL